MKRLKPKTIKVMHWIEHGCYPGMTMFSCGFSYDEIMKTLKRKRNTEDWILGISDDAELINSGTYFALRRAPENTKTSKKKELFYIIITDLFTFTDFEMCKLAHECLHICQFFLPALFDRNKEYEAEAYFHTHLMKECLKALRLRG